MEHSTFKLVLTHQAKQFIQSLLQGNNQEINFIIALGKNGKPASSDDIQLIEQQIEKEALLVELDSAGNGVHLNAIFPTDYFPEREFDIHEIGVFLTLNKKDKFLFGRYASEQIIAKKNSFIDFFIDLIIDISAKEAEKLVINTKNYLLDLPMAHATEQKYGTVRLATKEDMINKIPKRVLTTDLIPDLSMTHATEQEYGVVRLATNEDLASKVPNRVLTTDLAPYFSLNEQWSCLETVMIDSQGKNLELHGLHFLDSKQEEVLIILIGEIETKNSDLAYLSYNINGQNKKTAHIHTINQKWDASRTSINYYKYYDDGISFLISHQGNGGDNKSRMAEIIFPFDFRNSSKKWFDDKMNIFGNNCSWASSIVSLNFITSKNNDGYIVLLGGLYEPRTEIGLFTSVNRSDYNNPMQIGSLLRPRIKPLVHVIGEKVYILGGYNFGEGDDKELFHTVEVLIFRDSNQPDGHLEFSSFSPRSMLIKELEYTNNLFSCVVGNFIYIFNIYHFLKNYAYEERFYYRYDYAANTWEKKTIPDSAFIDTSDETNLDFYGKAISAGNDIYLFLIRNYIENDASKTILYVRKLTVS